MQYRFTLFLVLIFSFSLNLWSQNYSIKEGKPAINKAKPLQIIGFNNDSLIVVSKFKKEHYLIKYETDSLKIVSSQRLNLQYRGKSLYYVDFIKIQDKSVLISFFNDYKKKKSFFIAQEYDFTTLKPNASMFVWSNSYLPSSEIDKGFFLHTTSTDKSKTLIVNSTDGNSEVKDYILISLYANDSMQQDWQQEVKIPLNLRTSRLKDIAVTNKGMVYFLIKKYLNKTKEIRHGKLNFRYVAFRYDVKSKKLVQLDFDFNSLFPFDLRMAINTKQKVICSGFVYDKENSKFFAQSYLFDLSKGRFNQVDKKTAKFYDKWGKYQNKNGFYPTIVSQNMQAVKPDGSMIYLAEQRINTTVHITVPPTYQFMYMQNMAFLMDSNGVFISDFELHKKQSLLGKNQKLPTPKDYFDPIISSPYSYLFFHWKKEFYFLYNESSLNIEKEQWGKFYLGKLKYSYPMICKVNKNSNNQLYTFNANPDVKMRFYLNTIFFQKNQIYFFSIIDDKQALIELSIDK